jgi:type IV secretion system protein TrbB
MLMVSRLILDIGTTEMQELLQVTERRNEKLVRELGPLVASCLEDHHTEDILLNPDGRVWVKRTHQGFEVIGSMLSAQALSAFGTIAAIRDTVINHDNPILETELPTDGSRFEGLIPPVVRQPVFAIRQRPHRVFTLSDYETVGILTDKSDELNRQRRRDYFVELVRGKRHAEVIRTAIALRKNILVAGSTGSGKTTFINAVLNELANISPDDRVLIIEDTPELQCNVKNSVALLAVGRVSMLDCLRASMRLKPTRIVVGEVRGAEALSMLKAWNTGHPGGAASVHANDAHGALIRLESLVAEATAAPQRQLIAEAVNVVVFVDGEPSIRAGRKVREVAVVTGYRDGDYELEYV